MKFGNSNHQNVKMPDWLWSSRPDLAPLSRNRVKALEEALAIAEAKVSIVTVKLPPFWSDKAQLRFAKAEAKFVIRNVTQSKTGYNHKLYTIKLFDHENFERSENLACFSLSFSF